VKLNPTCSNGCQSTLHSQLVVMPTP